MVNEILVNVRRRKTPEQRCSVIVNVDDDQSTVDTAKSYIATTINVPKEHIRLIFSGRALDDNNQLLQSLQLGPTTSLLALIDTIDQSTNTSTIASLTTTNTIASSFYVYCKQCNQLQSGKLRLRCDLCKSDAVQVHPGGIEPSCWDDVLIRSRIAIDCFDCKKSNCYAEFYFKCIECSALATPLNQIRSNRTGTDECVICGETDHHPVVSFSCMLHRCCIECFVAYTSTCLDEHRFAIIGTHGYTISCAIFGCPGLIIDAHHFRLLTSIQYDRYQRMATQMCVLADSNGAFCPRAGCESVFFVDTDHRRVMCPECDLIFCRACGAAVNDDDDSCCRCDAASGKVPQDELPNNYGTEYAQSLVTIAATCKKCPSCRAPTERNSGCAHMNCRQCGNDWCWICEKRWTEDCQWNHWFD